jgi:ribonuclease R
MAAPRPRGLPSRQQILDFIAKSPVPVGKREIAKAFKVGPADRVALKAILREIQQDGGAERTPGRRLAPPEALPEIAVIEVVAIDEEGDGQCRLLGDGDGPILRLGPGRGETALGLKDRAVAKLLRQSDGTYIAVPIRKLRPDGERVLGVYSPGRTGGIVTPTDRRHKATYHVRQEESLGAVDGDLVLAIPLPLPRLGLPHVQILERLGRLDDPRSISLVAIHQHGIPHVFSEAAIAEAEAAKPVTLGSRVDLRNVPLITIDGPDARDFDDAVWAEPDPDVTGGWRAIVAIADVSWYVRPGSALDIAAQSRGNSVYFPDRVVPMLPEALSNELCSLKPEVERACLAIRMRFDAEGNKTDHEVVRGLMRSVARLTYEEVQAAIDGPGGGRAAELLDPVLRPLYGVYGALEKARAKRGTLDLDLPERQIRLDAEGRVVAIGRRDRLDSHKLIEELMIAANVAAAETLEKRRQLCMYRIHDAPDPERVASLRELLHGIGIEGLKLAKGQSVRPHHFNQILAAAVGRPEAALINDVVLRCQSQAAYAPENIGHFGLALRRYAHFTSPIRRYADLLVHRALVAGLGLGEGGLETRDIEAFAELGQHISKTERRAAQAERSTVERYVVAYLKDRVGDGFSGRVSGVTRFGLFVSLDESGADGLLPMSRLPADYYHHDADRHRLVGQRTNRIFTLGDRLDVQLTQADPVAGGLTFALIDEGPTRTSRRIPTPKPGRPPGIRTGKGGRKRH